MARAVRIATCAFVISLAGHAYAQPKCVVRLHDAAGGDAGWPRAVRTIERDVEAAPGDCTSVDVRVDGDGASIELRTDDGRAAERRVHTPAEAPPLVRALLIGFDAPIAPEPEVPPPPVAQESSPEPSADPSAPIPDTVVDPPKPKSHPEVFTAVGAGVELQTNDGASGVGQAIVGISLRAWQVGAYAKWEFDHHQDADSDPRSRHSSLNAAGGGAMFGRRQAVGPVTLVFGTSLGLYSAEQARGGHRNQTPHVEDAVLDPRGGLYFGALFPATGRIRTRAQLDGEVAFVNHSAGAEFPNVPQWGMGLSVGVDFGLIP